MADAVEPPRATRRSQRAARATPTKEPQPPLPSAVAAVPVAMAEAPMSPVAQSPTKQEARKDDGDGTGEGEGGSSSALLLTPTRNRRPSRRQLEVDAPTERAQLLLGAFSAGDATALCEVVWYQLKENSHRPDVLLRERSPARIDWHRVAERLARSHEIALTPRACQRLWKFLAYAQDVGGNGVDALVADSEPEDYELTADKINARQETPAVEKETTTSLEKPIEEALTVPSTPEASTQCIDTVTPAQDASSVVPSSESVQIEEQTGEVNASTASTEITQPASTENAEPATIENAESMDTTSVADPKPAAASATTTDGVPQQEANDVGSRETLRTAGIQLYPQHDQPTGVPSEWQKPFDVKRQMPLVFVAEKFLRRKVVPPRGPTAENGASSSMEVDPSILAAAAMSVTLTREKAQPKPKKKRASEAGGEEKKPKKPRKKKDPAAAGTAAATATKGTSAAASAASTPVPVASKSPAPIRQSYVPSPTAPPSPTPARPALDFFGQLYRENPSILRSSGSAEEKTETPTEAGSTAPPPSSAATLDAAQIEAIFINAPLHVRAACEQMASDDLRRFEREQLRRRLWEKARASLQNSPAPSPAASSQAPPAPPPTPSTVVPAAVAKVATSTTVTSPAPESSAAGATEASQVISNASSSVETVSGTTSQTSTPEEPGTQVS